MFSIFVTPAFAEVTMTERAVVAGAHGIYVQGSGEVWLADTFKNLNSLSYVYGSSGKAVMSAASGAGIGGISKHPKSDKYSFCDVMGSQILWLNSAGVLVNSFSVQNPWNARWTPSGDAMFVVTYAGSVLRISADLSVQEILSDLDAPFDIAPTGENGFWVSEQGAEGEGRVCHYLQKPGGNSYVKTVCNSGQLDNPEGLWPLADGSVAAVDTEKGTMVKIRPDGATLLLAKDLGIPILIQGLGRGDWVVYTNKSSLGPALVYGHSPELQ